MAELATIARPYAEALYQVARQGDLSAWGQQVRVLAEVAANAEVRQFADSLVAERGVRHGKVHLVPVDMQVPAPGSHQHTHYRVRT